MNRHEHLLSTEHTTKALLKLSVPAMIGMIVMALYNLVDTIFVGRGVGVVGIAAVAVVFPIQMIVMALAQTVGIGGASLISRLLGAKQQEEAQHVLGNMFVLVTGFAIVVTILGYIFLDPLLRVFGATADMMPTAHTYGMIILFGTLFFSITMASNNVIRAEGNAKAAMYTMVVGAVLNMIGDPIFIFGFKMGIAGAAYSTILSQAVSFVYVMYFFLGKKSVLHVHFDHLKMKWNYVREMMTVGFSSFIRMAAGSAMAIVINSKLASFDGTLAIATFGIINRLLAFVFMPLFGIVQGMQPLVGYNIGAKSYTRVREVIYLSTTITTVMSIIAFAILFIFPRQLLLIFSSDTQLIEMGVHATRIIILFLATIGFQVIVGGMYQSMGRAKEALFLSSLRQVIFLIPLVLILPRYFGIDGVWYAFPVSDFFSVIITWFMYVREMRVIRSREV